MSNEHFQKILALILKESSISVKFILKIYSMMIYILYLMVDEKCSNHVYRDKWDVYRSFKQPATGCILMLITLKMMILNECPLCVYPVKICKGF